MLSDFKRCGQPKSKTKIIKLVFIFVGILVAFFLGTQFNKMIPQTFLTSPLLTWEVMKDFPLGTAVLPIKTPIAKDQFEKFGWWKEPAIIVGYEVIKFDSQMVILCQVRTHKGKGYIIPVNPVWLRQVCSMEDSDDNGNQEEKLLILGNINREIFEYNNYLIKKRRSK